MTGSAVPEQKATEADILFGVDGTDEEGATPESITPLTTKAVPETVAAQSTGSITPEEAPTVGVPEVAPEEANVRSQPDRLGVKGLPAGESGTAGNPNLDLGCLASYCMCQ